MVGIKWKSEVVDIDTGEVKTYEQIAFEYIKQTSEEKEKKLKNKRDYLEKKKSNDNFYKSLNIHCGSFYFLNYNSLLEKEHLFRFIYLCTFMDYDNIILYGNGKNKEGKKARKKDLQEILKLKDGQFYPTLKYFIDNELILINEEEIKVNKKYCIRGKKEKKEIGVTRMFDNGIKELYEKATTREHNKLSLFIKMLPYIHYESNVICYNPEVEDIEEVQRLSLVQLAKELGYSTPQKLKKGLMELKIKDESLIMVATINNKSMIVVNPRLYYRGSNIDNLVGVVNLFKIAQK